MARLVTKTAHGNYKLKVGDKTFEICMCGLSKNQPFCDKSHKLTLDEEPDKLYEYHSDGTRDEIIMKDEEEGCCGGGCCGGEGAHTHDEDKK